MILAAFVVAFTTFSPPDLAGLDERRKFLVAHDSRVTH